MAKKEQPLFVKFYNLHLTSEAGSYPGEDERKRLIEFFSEHEPRITDEALYAEAARASADSSLMKNGTVTLDKATASGYPHLAGLYSIARLYYGWTGIPVMELNYKQVDSLLEYELYGFMLHLLARVKKIPFNWYNYPEVPNSEKFIDSNGELCPFERIFGWFVSERAKAFRNIEEDRLNSLWFNSGHFSEFLDTYRSIRSIVDGYISGRILNRDLRWLNENLNSYKLILTQIPENGTDASAHPVGKDGGQDSETILDDYRFEPGLTREKDAESYGVDLNVLLGKIYQGLVELLSIRTTLQYCSIEQGKRTPSCCNIFVPSKRGQKFCSNECRLKYHNSKKAEYMKEKRDPNSPEFDIRYVIGFNRPK